MSQDHSTLAAFGLELAPLSKPGRRRAGGRRLRRAGLAVEALEYRRLLSAQVDVHGAHGDHDHADAGAIPLSALPYELRQQVAGVSERGAFVTRSGNEFMFDAAPALVPQLSGGGSGGGGGGGGSSMSSTVPIFESNPSSSKKIYLDFNGQVVTGTIWNSDFYNNDPIHAPPYSTDNDLFNFSTTELADIEETWRRIAEDFAPFNVDVTTREPPSSAFTAGATALRVMISTNIDEASMGGTGNQWFSNAGGVAYLGSWRWTSDTPVWVFENNLANGWPKYVAEAASHEVGHGFDLIHDGIINGTAYYQGHGSGPTGWATIMGVGYYRMLSQWSKGEYTSANNLEDDLALITQSANQVSFRSDDVGNSTGSAAVLPATDPSSGLRQFEGSGVISTRTDVDVWRLELPGTSGHLSLEAAPAFFVEGYNNLDLSADLLSSTGSLIQSVNPADDVDAFLDLDLAGGTYYLRIDGVGKGTASTGYTDYASLGFYDLFGDWEYDGGGGGNVFNESGGRVDIEAEGFTGQAPGSGSGAGHTWNPISDGSAGGGAALVANPNSNVNLGDATNGPRRDFAINFTNTGTYYVWVRMAGASGSDDSLHVGLDGVLASSNGGVSLTSAERNGAWFWKDRKGGNVRVTVNVSTPGVHTLNLWMREDGTKVDQFILSNNPAFDPNSGGGGFNETGGRVDFQAEASTGSAPGSGSAAGHTWNQISDGSAGGGAALIANPNSNVNVGDATNGPRRDYAINFNTTGTYYVWVRMAGASGNDDSLHVGMNGALSSSGGGISLASSERNGAWFWKDRNLSGTRMTVNVPSPGVRTFNLWMREDGAKVDQFILTRDPSFNPDAPAGQTLHVEAEAPSAQQPGSGSAAGHAWSSFASGTASGGSAMVVNPNSNLNLGDSTSGPRLDYSVNLTAPGTYYVWARMSATNGSDDSIHVGLNGSPASFGSQGMALDSNQRDGAWYWHSTRAGGARVTLNVAAAGAHVFNAWMREDGARIDKFILTTDAGFVPS